LHAIGLTPATTRQLLEWPAERVLEAQQAFTDVVARETVGLPLPYQPVIDGRSIPRLPLEAIRAGEGSEVDLIVGTNLNEGSFFTTMGEASMRTDQRFTEALQKLTGQNLPLPAAADVSASYRAQLETELGRSPSVAEAVEAFLSDVQYRQPSNRLLEARAAASGHTYSYLFSWPSPTVPGLGSGHTLELPFVFGRLDHLENIPLVGDSPPVALSEAMTVAWASFAATGEPVVAGSAWPDYDREGRATVQWDSDIDVTSDPRGGLREWWIDAREGAVERGAA
ncbi:MAG: carboxylesterase family protein, partial [Microbacterium sp.]